MTITEEAVDTIFAGLKREIRSVIADEVRRITSTCLAEARNELKAGFALQVTEDFHTRFREALATGGESAGDLDDAIEELAFQLLEVTFRRLGWKQ